MRLSPVATEHASGGAGCSLRQLWADVTNAWASATAVGRVQALFSQERFPGARGEWHTFWNAGDEPCRILEIIAPAGFENFFSELVDLGGVTATDPDVLRELCQRYALEMDPSSIPGLIERSGVRFPGEPLNR